MPGIPLVIEGAKLKRQMFLSSKSLNNEWHVNEYLYQCNNRNMCKVQKQCKGKGNQFNWEVLREELKK